jgi:pyrroline-5-carboxylate reductase
MSKIGFIGAGRMATAMVRGMLAKKVCRAEDIICTSALDNTAERLARETGVAFSLDLKDLMPGTAVLVLAIKPQQLAQLPDEIAADTEGKLIISILAGKTLATLSERFPKARNIVRVMPNTPGQIGAGVSAFAAQVPLSSDDAKLVRTILGSLGEWVELPEPQIDAVTGLSGSGPAYVFEFIAALREGGTAAGLAPEVAARLALETVLGAARLVKETGEQPETLRDLVTSPGGTTLAGLKVMEEAGFRDLLRDTVLAAKRRSEELSG